MMTVLLILAAWFAISLFLGLIVGHVLDSPDDWDGDQ